MNVQMTAQDALHLTGITVKTADLSGSVASSLIRQLSARMEEIKGRTSDLVYLVSTFPDDYMPGREFTMFAGVAMEVISEEAQGKSSEDTSGASEQMPEGMTSQQLPAHQYAVVTHQGSVDTLGQEIQIFLTEWLPNSDYVEAAPFHFQVIDPTADPSSAAIRTWFPVILKSARTPASPSAVPHLKYDGGYIHVLWDYHEAAVEWYSKHFLWKSGETHFSTNEKLTRHAFGTWIKSVLSDHGPHPELTERGVDSNVRWCWNTKDITLAYRYFKEQGIRLSEIYTGPGDRYYFDLWATCEGTRLTVCSDPDLEEDYGARLCPGWVRIGVRDVEAAKAWYQKYVGMSVLEEHPDKGQVLMELGVEHHPGRSLWWLETLPDDAYTGPINGSATPYCVVHDTNAFRNYHQFLRDQGISVSDISGNLHGFARFHFFDPDGNRFSIQKY